MTDALVVLAVNNGWLMRDMVSDPIFLFVALHAHSIHKPWRSLAFRGVFIVGGKASSLVSDENRHPLPYRGRAGVRDTIDAIPGL